MHRNNDTIPSNAQTIFRPGRHVSRFICTLVIIALTSLGAQAQLNLVSNKNPACNGDLITFTATKTPPTAGWVQLFIDGVNQGAPQPLVGGVRAFTSGLATGTYTITAVYSTDAAGTTGLINSNAISQDVNDPVTLPQITGPTSVCQNQTITLVNTQAGGTWSSSNTGVATVNAATGVVTGVAGGTATITYTYNNGCVTTETQNITVYAVPTATVTGTTSVCSGLSALVSVALTGTGPWSITMTQNGSPLGTFPVTTSPFEFVTAPGATTTYAVTLVTDASPGGCPGTITGNAVVTVNPTPNVGAIAGPTTVCAGSTINLTDPTGGGVWSSSDPSKATVSAGGVVSGVASGGTVITYTVSNAFCSNAASYPISVNQAPAVNAVASAATICAGQPVTLTSSVAGTVATTTSFTNSTIGTFRNGNPRAPLIRAINVTGLPASMAGVTYTVTVNANHTIVSDVEMYLVAPWAPNPTLNQNGVLVMNTSAGNSILLTADQGGNGDNYTNTVFSDAAANTIPGAGAAPPFTGTFRPEGQPLGSLNSGDPNNGAGWRLYIFDDQSDGALGNFLNWTITFTYGSGSAGTYAWTSLPVGFSSAAQNPPAVSPAVTTTYTVTFTESSSGCKSTDPVTVTVNPLPTITGTLTVCAGSTTQLTGSGTPVAGTAWTTSNGAIATVSNTGLVTGIAAGTATITYTNNNGCQQTANVTVTASPTLVVTNPAAVCAPNTVNLTAAAVTAGSTGGLTYTYWTDAGATSAYLTPAAATAGTYYIKGTNGSGCFKILPVVVTVSPQPTVTITDPAPVCAPATVNLTAAAVTAGSTGGLTFTYWTNVAGTIAYATPAAATNGTYYIKGTNASGCFDIKPVTVTVNPAPTITVTNPAAVCTPATVDITLAAVTAGSTAGLTYTYWTNAAATTTFATPTTAGAGTYYIKGTNAGGCSDIKPVVVTVNPSPTVTITNPAAVCAPATVNLTVAAVTAGSTGGLTYTYWTNAAATTPYATPTTAANGTYYIKGTTAGSCFDIKPVVVTVNPAPTVTITNPAAICAPGTVNITAAGVTAGSTAGLTYTYFTDAAGTVPYATPAAATNGTYYIKGTTAGSCFDIKPVVVTVNPVPTVTITNPAAVCAPATVNLTAGAITTGSTAGLTYTYFTDAAGTIPYATPGTAGAGTYYIKGTSAGGCFDIKPVVVAVNPAPTISGTLSVCIGGTTQLTGSGTPLAVGPWTSSNIAQATVNATGLVSGVAAGSPVITYTNISGCSITATVVVNPRPVVTTPAITTAIACAGGTTGVLTTTALGGLGPYTYLWSNGATTNPATGLGQGSYTVVATDSRGCASLTSGVRNLPDGTPLAIPTANIVQPTCAIATGSVSFLTPVPAAGITYSVDGVTYTNTTGVFNGLASGGYTITYKNASGCVSPGLAVTINAAPATPAAPTINITQPTCAVATGTITVTSGTAGLTFSLDGGPFAAYPGGGYTGVTSGAHTLTAQNAAGCTSPVTNITVNAQPATPTAPAINITQPTCAVATGTVTVSSGTAGLTFSLDGGPFAAYPAGGYTGVTSGAHTLSTQNAAGCTSPATNITVNAQPATPTAPTINITQPTCAVATGTVTVTSGTAGLTLSLDGGPFAAYPAGGYTGVTSGAHTLTVQNAAGCTSNVTNITVNAQPASPAAPTTNVTQPTCVVATGTITVTSGTAGLTFSLDGGPFAAYPAGGYTGVTTGAHTLTAQNAAGCTSPVTNITVNAQPASPTAPTINTTQPTCAVATGTVTVTSGTAGLTFSLDGGAYAAYPAGGYTGVASGAHTLSAQNAAGCQSANANITVNAQPASPAAPTTNVTQPTCAVATGTITVTSGTAGLTFSLDGGPFAAYPAGGFTGVATGAHTLTSQNAAGCTSNVANVTVNAQPATPAAPAINTTQPTCAVATGTITVTSGTAGLTFSLDGSPFAAYPAGGYTGVTSGGHTLTAQNAGAVSYTHLTLPTKRIV